MKSFRTLLLIGAIIGSALLSSLTFGTTSQAQTPVPPGSSDRCTSARFLTFPAWYSGLTKPGDNGNCDVKSPDEVGGISNFIWKIALNVVQIIMQVVAYIATGFIIYGGFRYLTSSGDPSKINKGRELIVNALIGLVISFVAVIIVSFIGASIG